MLINVVCTSKPGDGLLHYSYEHCSFLNSIGLKSQLVIITHKNFNQEDYINSLKECYVTYENVIFNEYTPASGDITLIMGRSMLTLAYLDKEHYSTDQLLSLRLLFKNNLVSVYSENHPKEYPIALKYFNPKKVFDLCDYDVYPNGVGKHFEKMINFDIYKPIKQDIQFDYLFLGTNKIYYREIEKVISNYKSHGIITYNENYINENYNNMFVPVKNLLGLFKTYVYTKSYFDPAPRIIQECKWLGKEIIYLRDKNIKDGGPVYFNRPVPTKQMYSNNISILLEELKL